MAKLAKSAFDGGDLRPLRDELIAKLLDGTADAGEGLDLSLIAQLLGDKQAGLAIQHEVLASHQLVPVALRGETAAAARAGARGRDRHGRQHADRIPAGGVRHRAEDALCDRRTSSLPTPLPDHDVAIVIASEFRGMPRGAAQDRSRRAALAAAAAQSAAAGRQPRSRQAASPARGIDGLEIPATLRATRAKTAEMSRGRPTRLRTSRPNCTFRSSCGRAARMPASGLARIDDAPRSRDISPSAQEQDFFVSRFVDYSSEDGLFRKYRVVFVDGKPYACHMAIADRWDIWYLNAGMAHSAEKRLEEETFMRDVRRRFCAASSHARLPRWPSASASIISPSIARRPRTARC